MELGTASCAICLKLIPEAQENSLSAISVKKCPPITPKNMQHKLSLRRYDCKSNVPPYFNNEARLAQSVRRLHAERVAVVRIFVLPFLFTSHMRSTLTEHAHFFILTSFPWYHMSFDAQIYKLQFHSGVFQCSKHGLDSSLEEPSPGQLGPHGSWGFSPVGGSRLYSEGEPVYVLSRKRKEDCSELLTVLAVILTENCLLDPCVVSSTRSGECRFSSGKICARANGPQNGNLHWRGTPESLVDSTQKEAPSPSPSTGRDRWG